MTVRICSIRPGVASGKGRTQHGAKNENGTKFNDFERLEVSQNCKNADSCCSGHGTGK